MSKEINELITEMGQLFEGYAFTEEELNKLEALYKKLKVVMAKEFEYPFETGEHCWFISSDGSVFRDSWNTIPILSDRYSQGNVFKIKQEAERERDKRALLGYVYERVEWGYYYDDDCYDKLFEQLWANTPDDVVERLQKILDEICKRNAYIVLKTREKIDPTIDFEE